MAEDPSPLPAATARGRRRGRGQGIDLAVGRRIRERRVMLGLTLQQVAEQVGITHQQLAKYERGVTRLSAGRLYQTAQALGADVGHFFEDLEPEGRDRAEPAGARAQRRMVLGLVRDVAGIGDRGAQEALCALVRALAAAGRARPDAPQVEQPRPGRHRGSGTHRPGRAARGRRTRRRPA
jgi:transcriptional regulator with XRE-family HTH domain